MGLNIFQRFFRKFFGCYEKTQASRVFKNIFNKIENFSATEENLNHLEEMLQRTKNAYTINTIRRFVNDKTELTSSFEFACDNNKEKYPKIRELINPENIDIIRKAIRENDLDLLKSRIDDEGNIKNSSGESLLSFAIDSRNFRIIMFFLEKKVNYEPYLDALLKTKNEAIHFFILAQAIDEKNCEKIKVLLNKKVNVNACGSDGSTPLCKAISNKADLDIIKLLVDNGANLNFKDPYGSTPLSKAILMDRDLEIIKFLIRQGADINLISFGSTYLNRAIADREFDLAKLLIEEGADPNRPNTSNNSRPLIEAINNCAYEIILLLLEKGADYKPYLSALSQIKNEKIKAFLQKKQNK